MHVKWRNDQNRAERRECEAQPDTSREFGVRRVDQGLKIEILMLLVFHGRVPRNSADIDKSSLCRRYPGVE